MYVRYFFLNLQSLPLLCELIETNSVWAAHYLDSEFYTQRLLARKGS